MRRSERGFTLTEMMIVVAIIAILSTLAIVYLRPKTSSLDVANRFADLVREASREAVSYGPVRADVATAQGSKQRTRIIATGGAGSSPLFELDRFVEDPSPATSGTWVTMRTYQVPSSVVGAGWSTGTGSYTALSGSLVPSWSSFSMPFYPSGTTEAHTLFFQGTTGSSSIDYYARVSVMPLGTAVYIQNNWN